MKVLIITYYWPPAGGSGVQRWLKFAKYLTGFGIEPIIYAPENAKYPTIDTKIENSIPNVTVIKRPIFNPQDLLSRNKKTSGVANISNGGFLSWVRGNFFIPDAKIFWVKPSVKFLTKYINDNEIDLIISSGPPHSIHLIAQQVKQKTKVKWIADFRDPWTTLYYAEDFNLSGFAKRKNKKLENKVLNEADAIITVSEGLRDELPIDSNKISVITNGYDDEVFAMDSILDEKFCISYIGLLPKQSNPTLLWEVLSDISVENEQFNRDLKISFTGNICTETIQELNDIGLSDKTEFNGYVPHEKVVFLQKQAQVLLLLIPNTKNSKGILTGKVFEYMISKRPILAIGDKEGDLASLLKETNTGVLVDFNDKEKLKEVVLLYYNLYLKNQLVSNPQDIEKYHRKSLTKSLVALIDKVQHYS